MYKNIVYFFVIFSNHCIFANKNSLVCPELEDSIIGPVLNLFSLSNKDLQTRFYLGSKNNYENLIISSEDLSALNSDDFNPLRKTYFIIHGYRSSSNKTWIKDMKNAIFKMRDVNIILVDWSEGSYALNFVDSVKNIQLVADNIFKLLQSMKSQVSHSFLDIQWNKLYFIGHSLGAHISGQIGHKLKHKDDFYEVERITGLDPAKPCFSEINNSFKLDKSDANFVDVIHTETGKTDKSFSFGLRSAIGHMDFYVNGGILQPNCSSTSIWAAEIKDKICSHKLARNYFIESILQEGNNSCKLIGHEWDRTYWDAVRVYKKIRKEKSCSDCAEMGINAIKYDKNGTYLVLTGTEEPFCDFGNEHTSKVKQMLMLLKENS